MSRKMFGLAAVMLAGVLVLAGCQNNEPEEIQEIGMPNPASVYCEENGGILIPMSDEDGEYALCELPDGIICEEWEYYRGECPIVENDEENIDEDENINDEEVIDEEVVAEEGDELPVAKMRVSDEMTQEEIENQLNEVCDSMGGVWEDGSCVLEDGSTIQF